MHEMRGPGHRLRQLNILIVALENTAMPAELVLAAVAAADLCLQYVERRKPES